MPQGTIGRQGDCRIGAVLLVALVAVGPALILGRSFLIGSTTITGIALEAGAQVRAHPGLASTPINFLSAHTQEAFRTQPAVKEGLHRA